MNKENEKLIIGAAVKRMLKSNELRMDSDFIKELDKEIKSKLKGAIDRAKANKRKTLKPCDL